jgi:hypothetical protein
MGAGVSAAIGGGLRALNPMQMARLVLPADPDDDAGPPPGADPGNDPGNNPSTDPSTGPSTHRGSSAGTDPGADSAMRTHAFSDAGESALSGTGGQR